MLQVSGPYALSPVARQSSRPSTALHHCRIPAVVITSSGTAVANLLPAVVEASQSRVPMLIMTADRPGELRDTGANQTIDQVV